MGITDDVLAAAGTVAAETGVPATALLAVAITETNGVAFAAFDGRREPLIRFEGHYFDRLLGGDARRRARAAGLAAAKAGAVRNPASQAARWRLLDRAAAIDAAAAYASTSWGLGQVMGAHWKRLGFASPDALAAEARASAAGQFRIMAAFLRLGGLDRQLAERRFAAFSRGYNGPGYARNRYDKTVEANFAKAGKLLARTPAKGVGVTSLPLPGAAPSKAGEGPDAWSRGRAMLGSALSWLFPRPSIRTATRSSSISMERSSPLPTTPPPSGSTLLR